METHRTAEAHRIEGQRAVGRRNAVTRDGLGAPPSLSLHAAAKLGDKCAAAERHGGATACILAGWSHGAPMDEAWDLQGLRAGRIWWCAAVGLAASDAVMVKYFRVGPITARWGRSCVVGHDAVGRRG